MYEMHVGAAVTGAHQVWHVVAHNQRTTLCGQPFEPAENKETDHHCLPCMTVFQRLVQTVEPA
ncbi:hypothetical protein ABZX93_26750 [Streptomyces sp. NPDC006632]|uniref:hypothetical protein n=1 Tax=unclassified Streptomyces TaxID=2593676 RepID=UPI002E224BC5